MNSILRAAGFAAASLLALIGTAYAAPSQAWDAVQATSFIDHASASIQAADLDLNPVDDGGVPVAAPAPAQAAEAPVPAIIPETVADPEPETRRPLAELVAELASASTADPEHECLAGAVYFEAKGEPLSGQLSVAEVVLNRAGSGRFPASVCGVVKQRGQFSFIRAGRFPPIARASAAWRRAVAIARIALDDKADGPAPRALFFHARRVSPGWRGLTRIATVGNHVFYR